MLKRILSLLCALSLLTAVLCGCGSGSGGSSASDLDSSGASGNESSAESSSEAGAAGEATLKFISWMTKGEDLPVLDDFMAENPGIKVTNQSLDGTNYQTLVNTMLMGGEIPDVFLVNSNMIPDLVKGGYIQPITGIAGVDKQQANPAINELLSYDGEVYAYAVNGSKGDVFVYYNKLYFEENNLAVPTTVEEFDQLMADILALGDEPLAVSAGDTWSANYPAFNLSNAAIRELNLTGSHAAEKALLTGEKKLSDLYGDSFRKLADYYQKGYVSLSALSMGWEQAAQYLVDGGAQLLVSGNWVPGSTPVQESDPAAFAIGCFPLPVVPCSDGKYYIGSSTDRVVVLSAHSEHPEAALKLFEYWIRDDVLVKYLERQGLLGINVSAKVDPVFDYAYGLFEDTDKYAFSIGDLAMMPPGYNPNMAQYYADIYSGVDVQELLDKLDADYDAAMSTVDLQEYIDAIDALNA